MATSHRLAPAREFGRKYLDHKPQWEYVFFIGACKLNSIPIPQKLDLFLLENRWLARKIDDVLKKTLEKDVHEF